MNWDQRAACIKHPNPNLWTPDKVDDPAVEARWICHEKCPVRLECGEAALRRRERHTVAGGYRMWQASDVTMLRAELPHVAAELPNPKRHTMACTDCGRSFDTTQGFTRCKYCRMGLVDADPIRAHLHKLRKTMTTEQIGARSGIAPNTLSGILKRTSPPRFVAAKTARCVLAIEVPEQVRT